MKLRAFVIMLVLVFSISSGYTLGVEDDLEKISKALEENSEVSIIVWLENNEFTKPEHQDLNKKREEIKRLQSEVLADLGNDVEVRFLYKVTNGFAGAITRKGFERLKNNNKIDKIYLDGEIQEALIESRPLIKADLVESSLGYTGSGITVCTVDSGVDYTHPALGGCFGPGCKVVDGYDFCVGTGCAAQDPDPMDERGHGTHVAGIIALNDFTYRGIAPNANLVANKIFNNLGYSGKLK